MRRSASTYVLQDFQNHDLRPRAQQNSPGTAMRETAHLSDLAHFQNFGKASSSPRRQALLGARARRGRGVPGRLRRGLGEAWSPRGLTAPGNSAVFFSLTSRKHAALLKTLASFQRCVLLYVYIYIYVYVHMYGMLWGAEKMLVRGYVYVHMYGMLWGAEKMLVRGYVYVHMYGMLWGAEKMLVRGYACGPW